MTIPTDVRAAARELLFAMELKSPGPTIRERTQRLLYALGDQTHEPPANPPAAVRLVLRLCVDVGIMAKHEAEHLLTHKVAQLWHVVGKLDGKLVMQDFVRQKAPGAALLYIVVLLLARAEQDVLLVH